MSDFISPEHYQYLVGYYGKVPTHGDFVGRGLPTQFREPWDTWLQQMMHVSKQQLGAVWMQHFLTFPVYRFALSAGVCGEHSWLGVLIPSVDQIGRYYPMTLCRSIKPASKLLAALTEYRGWYEQAETLVLSCLNDDFVLENFELQLTAMQEQINQPVIDKPEATTHLQRSVHKHPHAAWRVGGTGIDELTAVTPLLLQNLLDDFCTTYSFWFTQGSEEGASSLLLAKGLPPFAGAAALLDGQWQQWGWNTNLSGASGLEEGKSCH